MAGGGSSQRIGDLIKEIRKGYKVFRGTYGSPGVTRALNKEGIICGRNLVARLMQENGIAARTKKKYKASTNSKHNYPVAGNLINQNFTVDWPNQVWVAILPIFQRTKGGCTL